MVIQSATMSSSSSFVCPELEVKIQQKREERLNDFKKLRGLYGNHSDNDITLLPFGALREKLQSREISARQALEAFTAKALEITEKFNCVTEFIPQAQEWASKLDEEEPLTIVRPLRGLPVAIKDDHDVEGMDTTLGLAKRLYKPVRESAVLVKVLLELGAVPFLKTNVPQSLFSNGSDNPIFGTTLNALNIKLAPGGSSSGSACLVAAGGATFATGSDLGGSLRTPSHFHGVCSLRPTANRLSDKGVAQCLPELVLMPGVPGIITPDAKTLAFNWKAITEHDIQNRFDPMAVPIPWNETLFASSTKLKIGYFASLPFFPAFEDTQKTVLAARDAFQSNGHSLVEFQMPDDFHYVKVICNLLLADQGRYLEKVFQGEPISYCVAGLVESIRKSKEGSSSIPGVPILGRGDVDNDNMSIREKILLGDNGPGGNVKTSGDLWNLANEKRLITQDMVGRMEQAGVDLILSPAFPFPAVKMEHGHELGFVYTVIWNFINFPAGVVRFGTEWGSGVNRYDDQNDPVLKSAKVAISDSAGMPINVQIIGKPFKEELVLRAMVELEQMRSDHKNSKFK